MKKNKIGIIGGSGLENPDILKNPGIINIETPYGQTSAPIDSGEINGVKVLILSRHDKEHTIPPTQINNRANIYALKELGCSHIIATTACGSLKQEIGRGDLIFPDQFIDFTRHRKTSFFEHFEPGAMKHTPMSDPFSVQIRNVLIDNAKKLALKYHEKGTVITIEGPRFSSRAESVMFQNWGADIINMSTAPEVILANEIGIPYAAIAMSTDYDCWKTDEDPVTWEEVIKVFNKNVKNVIDLILSTIPAL